MNRVLLQTVLATLVLALPIRSTAQDAGQRHRPSPEGVKNHFGARVDEARMQIAIEEGKKMYQEYLAEKRTRLKSGLAKTEVAPNWQWAMSPVEDQNNDPYPDDCWAHAATGAAEGQLHIFLNNTNVGINLDETDIVVGTGIYHGGGELDAWYYMQLSRVPSTYEGVGVGSYPNAMGVRWGLSSSGHYQSLGTLGVMEMLRHGPVTGTIHVSNDFEQFFWDNHTGVYHYNGCGLKDDAYHTVVIVSYDEDQDFWLCKNSWGSLWGDGGYFRIGFGELGIDAWDNGQVFVDQECLAKFVPNHFPTPNAAFASWTGTGETVALSGSASLSGPLTIPSGRTFSLLAGSNLNWAGNYIDANGTFDFREGCGLCTGIRYTSSFYYSTMTAALNAAVSGQTVTVLRTNQNADERIIPSGVTLHINNSTIMMNGHSITTSGGSIFVEGASTLFYDLHAILKNSSGSIKGLCGGTIQAAINNATFGDIIEVQSGTFAENLTISGRSSVTLAGQGADQTHITGQISGYSCYPLIIQGLSCTTGILLNDCDYSQLISTTVASTGATTIALNAVNSSNLVLATSTLLSDHRIGLALNASSVETYPSVNIMFNGMDAVSAQQNSSAYCNDNLFCSTNRFDLVALTGSYVEAYNCTYDNGVPSISGNASATGTIGNCNGLLKGQVASSSGQEGVIGTSEADAFQQLTHEFWNLNHKYRQIGRATAPFDTVQYRSDHFGLIGKLSTFIDADPSSELTGTALTLVAHCYRRIQDYNGMKKFMSEISMKPAFQAARANGEKTLALLAERYLMDAYRGSHEFEAAIKIADGILQKEKVDSAFIAAVLYSKGLLYAHELKLQDAATACFSSVVNILPGDPLAEAATSQLGLLRESPDVKRQAIQSEAPSTTVFSCRSYPNPFNPSTTINYQLPVDGFVSLRVFDLLGREVIQLANGYHRAGSYGVLWDATRKGVASGVYFVNFTVSDKLGKVRHSEVNKVLLMK